MPVNEIDSTADRCFSVADLAHRWKVRPQRIRDDIRRGTIPAFNVGVKSTSLRIAPEVVLDVERGMTVVNKPKARRRRGYSDVDPRVVAMLAD